MKDPMTHNYNTYKLDISTATMACYRGWQQVQGTRHLYFAVYIPFVITSKHFFKYDESAYIHKF